MLYNNKTLESINLSGNKFDSDSLTNFANALQENKMIRFLYLNNTNLNEENSVNLFQNFNETTIEELSLNDNNIGDTGFIIFSNSIKNNWCLYKLSLVNTKISPASMLCLTKSIEINKSLKELDLSENMFATDSLAKLIAAVRGKKLKVRMTKKMMLDNVSLFTGEEENFILV